MRIAILTIPLNANYGGILQAYALQTTLENIGVSSHLGPSCVPQYILAPLSRI